MAVSPRSSIDRVNRPIPTRELERRWAAVRRAMEQQQIDVLLMQSNNDFVGGYVKYFTDVPATNGYSVTVVFPRDDRMTVIGQGPFGLDRTLPADGDLLRRGVGRMLGVPSYASVEYTARYDADLCAKALAPYARATIGLLGTASISFALMENLRTDALREAKFVNAADVVDPIKAVKSPDEIAFARETAGMQDAAMREALSSLRPGMRDLEVAAVAEQVGHSFGSEQGLFLAQSAPVGAPAQVFNRHLQNRTIEEGDQFSLLVENNGPGGYYTELGRLAVFGKATDEMRENHEFVLEAQRFALELLAAGRGPTEIWSEYNAFLRARGRPEEKRVFFHGQGYDMVERPLARFDETMPIERSTYFAVHPSFLTETSFSWTCDTFLYDSEGKVERLHAFPQEIVELG